MFFVAILRSSPSRPIRVRRTRLYPRQRRNLRSKIPSFHPCAAAHIRVTNAAACAAASRVLVCNHPASAGRPASSSALRGRSVNTAGATSSAPERSATALPQPRVIAEPEIPPHKLRNSLLGVCFGIAAEPFGVILSGSASAVHPKWFSPPRPPRPPRGNCLCRDACAGACSRYARLSL